MTTTEIIETDEPLFARLRELAAIETKPDTGDVENARSVLGYAHGLFRHNGDNQPSAMDPITIITEAQSGSEFRCVEYSLLGVALLWAYGIPARFIGLKTSDVETREYGAGHVVVEFWSRELDRWIMCDVQAGLMTATAGAPLSAFELREMTAHKQSFELLPVIGSRYRKDAADYRKWIKEYLYFIDTPTEITFDDIDLKAKEILMLVPDGVKPPRMFQGMFEMNAVYTYSVEDFYARP
jgi:hypothetical protein